MLSPNPAPMLLGGMPKPGLLLAVGPEQKHFAIPATALPVQRRNARQCPGRALKFARSESWR
jgi:hypothetical protein